MSINETKFSKNTFNKIDKNHDSIITIDEVKSKKAELENELNTLLETSNGSHPEASSSGAELIATVISMLKSTITVVDVSVTSSSALSSSLVMLQTSSSLVKLSPTSVLNEFDDMFNELADATKDFK